MPSGDILSKGELFMATKKTAAAPKEVDFWKQRVPITLPLNQGNPEDQTVFVSVGDYSAQIQRGVEVMVPRNVAAVLQQSQKADIDAAMNRLKLQRQYEDDMRRI